MTAVAGNVADPNVAAALTSSHDRLDVFVNNAGISPRSSWRRTPALEMTREEWDQVMEVNLKAPWYLSVLAGQRMASQGSGVILFMSSVTAWAYFETSGSHYATSKTALVGLTRALAGGLAPLGVRVCGIAPGRVMTNMARTLGPAICDNLMGMIPLNRSGTPEDIAQAALFLARPRRRLHRGRHVGRQRRRLDELSTLVSKLLCGSDTGSAKRPAGAKPDWQSG